MVVDAALRNLGLDWRLEIIGNPYLFPDYNVDKSPTLMINNEIEVEGYIPSYDEIIDILSFYQ